MWALRRAANPLRNQGYRLGASQACCVRTEIHSDNFEDGVVISETTRFLCGICILPNRSYYHSQSVHVKLFQTSRFSSYAGANNSGEEDDFRDGCSELETPFGSNKVEDESTEEDNDELLSEPKFSEDDLEENPEESSYTELNSLESENTTNDEDSEKKKASLGLSKVVLGASSEAIRGSLDKWVEEGNVFGQPEISLAFFHLRKSRMYGKALQLDKWLEAKELLNFTEREYASRLDLIAKVCGIQKAEKYIEKIPKSFRGEVIYRTLLANCVLTGNIKKTEEIFDKMRKMDLSITVFAYNQMILFYKKVNMKKIADILSIMEKDKVKPSLDTYRHVVDVKGRSNDIPGMEELLETMKDEGFKPDILFQYMIARHYLNGGLNEKVETVLKDMEGSNLKDNRRVCGPLLQIYASLGKAEEVERVWKVFESNPRPDEFMAAIEAWGKLGKIEEAESIFEKMRKKGKIFWRHYTPLLKVYANHKLLDKGKELAKKMESSKSSMGPITWNALVNIYVDAGEVEKADSILQKASQSRRRRPMLNSYMAIISEYAKKGDVHNAEKIFLRSRQSGYFAIRLYQALLQAYINSKTPAYGFRERMKADNVFANGLIAEQLVQVDAFRKTAISELID